MPSVDKEHKNQHRGCAFVEFQHQVSVNYAIDLLNQISLYGYPMRVSYMTAGSNSGTKSSPTTIRPPPTPNGSMNYLSFNDSPITDARQSLAHNSRAAPSHGDYYSHPPSSSRGQYHNNSSGHGASHGSGYYPQWLRHDTIQQIHDWRERERERSRQSSYQHHHEHRTNGHPSSYR